MLLKPLITRDTTENWKQNNPILNDGEVGIERLLTNDIKIKVGDGITPWNNLPYAYDKGILNIAKIEGNVEKISDLPSVTPFLEGTTFIVDIDEEHNDKQAIYSVVSNYNTGVKEWQYICEYNFSSNSNSGTGTNSYNDLINKPLINGNTLIGDKSLAGLGIASSIDLNNHVLNNGIHVTTTNKTDWDNKYNKPSTGIPENDLSQSVKDKLNIDLSIYVEKQTGMGLSENSFTTAEKNKLSELEAPTFKGTFVDETALRNSYPTANEGDSADVFVSGFLSTKLHRFVWDNNDWTDKGSIGIDTAESIKEKYESNSDTNAFTDADKNKLNNAVIKSDLINETYSTTEINTKKIWIDGKPIYRRVFTGGITALADTNTVVYSIITGVETIICTGGMWLFNEGAYADTTVGGQSGRSFYLTLNASNNGININSISDKNRTNAPYKIWIEYTKV